MNKFEFLVLTSATDGTDEEFNRWYDNQHLQDVCAVAGFVSANRFRILESETTTGQNQRHQYATIYTMECDDPQTVLREMRERIGTPEMLISWTLDKTSVTTFLLEPISARRKPDAS